MQALLSDFEFKFSVDNHAKSCKLLEAFRCLWNHWGKKEWIGCIIGEWADVAISQKKMAEKLWVKMINFSNSCLRHCCLPRPWMPAACSLSVKAETRSCVHFSDTCWSHNWIWQSFLTCPGARRVLFCHALLHLQLCFCVGMAGTSTNLWHVCKTILQQAPINFFKSGLKFSFGASYCELRWLGEGTGGWKAQHCTVYCSVSLIRPCMCAIPYTFLLLDFLWSLSSVMSWRCMSSQ